MKRSFLFILVLFLISTTCIAQQVSVLDLLSLKLPPLETLYENAKKTSLIQYYDNKAKGEQAAIMSHKRSWLSFFSFVATYQYGVMGMNSYTNFGANYPLIYQNTGGEQLWYNIGGLINIPLDKLFDRRTRIKVQKAKIDETIKERDMMYDMQKIRILEAYVSAQRVFNQLSILDEEAVVSAAQFSMVEKDFIQGKTTAQGLSTAKSIQRQAYVNLENAKSELRTHILTLEILSNTKIMKD